MERESSIAVLLACAACTACTHTRVRAELDSHGGERGTAYARSGKQVDVRYVAGRGGPRFEPIDGSPALTLNEVDHVTFDSEARGAADGLFVGLLCGTAGGALIGALTWDEDENYLDRQTSTIVAAAGLGVIAGLVGIAVGAQLEATYRYDLRSTTP